MRLLAIACALATALAANLGSEQTISPNVTVRGTCEEKCSKARMDISAYKSMNAQNIKSAASVNNIDICKAECAKKTRFLGERKEVDLINGNSKSSTLTSFQNCAELCNRIRTELGSTKARVSKDVINALDNCAEECFFSRPSATKRTV